MYRILKADKDAYVTNKIIFSTKPTTTRSTDANTGQAGTLDLYKLVNATSVPSGSSGIELSRGLLHFDLSGLRSITGSILNPADPSFKCYVSLKDVYGGQTVPSNFDLTLYPLAKNWSEGRGLDVVGYRDLDVANWSTASLDYVQSAGMDYATVEYEEAVVDVPYLTNTVAVPFINTFTSIPLVVITDISSSNHVLVNAYLDNQTSISTLYVSFSTPFIGSFVYRAAYDPTPGTPRTVRRFPRYPDQYANVVFDTVNVISSSRWSVGYSDFTTAPVNSYATLYELVNDNLADVYVTITSSTSTSLGGAFSSQITDGQLNAFGYRPTSTVSGLNTWVSGGAAAGGTTGENIDYYESIFSPTTGYLPLGFTQHFSRGDEDLLIDVTPAVSATLAGYLPDYGFRLSYSGSQETDNITRFVKRFSTRQSRNTTKHPHLVVKYDDSFFDNQAQPYFDYPNKIGVYYSPFGVASNFLSSSIPITGSGSVVLELVASKSVYVTATTYSISHQATINYISASWNYFSMSFTGSQISLGGMFQTGSYYADVFIPSNTNGLSGVLLSDGTLDLSPVWKSPDNTVIFSQGAPLTFRPLAGTNTYEGQLNYAINITNLKDVYVSDTVAKLRVFVYDFDPTLTSFYLPYKAQPKVFPTMYWRVIDPYTKDVLIPFDDIGTKLSADGDGMYMSLFMKDLPINRPLEIEFLIKEYGTTYFIENQRFIFKVITA